MNRIATGRGSLVKSGLLIVFLWGPMLIACSGGGNATTVQAGTATTAAVPGAIQAAAAHGQVALAWTGSAGATSYDVKRSTTSGGPYVLVATVVATSFTDASIAAGASYFYVVSAVNAVGESANSTEVQVTTAAALPLPDAPTNVVAAAQEGAIGLTWNASAHATAYNIKRAATSGGPYTLVASPSSTAYSDTGLTDGTTYFYVVSALDANGESANSSEVSAAPGTSVQIPAVPSGVVAAGGIGQVSLSWTASSGATSYSVLRSLADGGPFVQIASATSSPFVDTGLANATTYYYVVTSVDSAGTSADSVPVSATPAAAIQIPAVPGGLAAVAGNAQVGLNWSFSTGATRYNVKRATVNGGPYAQLAAPSATTYADTSAVNGTTYWYVVSALDAAGESANSAAVTATPVAPVQVPVVPTGLVATPGNAQVALSWTASNGATAYHVKRATVSGGPYVQISAPAINAFVDASAVTGTTYWYVVSALDSAGESADSTASSATPTGAAQIPAVPAGLVATGGNAQVNLTWSVVPGATSYHIKRSSTSGGPYAAIGSSSSASFTDSGLGNSATWYYVVSALDTAGESANSAQASANTSAPVAVPAVPTSVIAAAGDTQVVLSWSASAGATSYHVKRATASGGPYAQIAVAGTASFTDTGVVDGTAYYYVVSALDGAGESANSAEAAATPTAPLRTWKTVPIGGGGYVDGLLFHPNAPNLLYARTDVGEAYRWDNAHARWIPLFDWLTSADKNYRGVESMALDPNDANKVYMMTGMYIGSSTAYQFPAAKLMISSDQGATWTPVQMAFPAGSNDQGRGMGERMAVDPNKPSILFYGSRTQGLWKSADSGLTWNRVAPLTFPNPSAWSSSTTTGLNFVVFDTSTTGTGTPTSTIYVGVAPTYASNAAVNLTSNLYRSTDAGATWNPIATPLQPYTSYYVQHMVRTGDHSFYLNIDNGPGPGGNDQISVTGTAGAVYKFDGASTWTALPVGLSGGLSGLSAVRDVSSGHDDILVTTTREGGSYGNPYLVFASKDGGATFAEVSRTAAHDNGGASYMTSWWNWADAAAIDPSSPDRVFYGTGAGIWSTSTSSGLYSAGQTAPPWRFTVANLEETVVTSLTAAPPTADYKFVSGHRDVAGFVHTSLDASPVRLANKVGTPSSDIAWSNAALIVSVGVSGNSPRGCYSQDAGVTWTYFNATPTSFTGKSLSNVAVSADGAAFLWSYPGAVPALSTDSGTTWAAPVGLAVPAIGSFTVAADRQNANEFYAYSDAASAGTFWVSTDKGATFSARPFAFPGNESAQIAVNPWAAGDVWLSNGSTLYHSVDAGLSWQSVGASSIRSLYGISVGTQRPGASVPSLYILGQIGTSTGAFESDDGGTHWTEITDAAHKYGGGSVIAADTSTPGLVYLGTSGRGVIAYRP